MPRNKKLTQSSLQKTMGGMVSKERRTEYAMTVLNNPQSSESNKKEMAKYMNSHPDQFVDVSQRGSFIARARQRISAGSVGSRSSGGSRSRSSRMADETKFQRDSDGKKTFTYDWYMSRTAGMTPSRRMSYAQKILDSSDTSEDAKNAVRDHMALFPERYQSGGSGVFRRNGGSNRSSQNSGSQRVQGVTLSNEEFDSLSKFQKFIFSHFRRGTRNSNAAYALRSLVNDSTSSSRKSDIKKMVNRYPQWFFLNSGKK